MEFSFRFFFVFAALTPCSANEPIRFLRFFFCKGNVMLDYVDKALGQWHCEDKNKGLALE